MCYPCLRIHPISQHLPVTAAHCTISGFLRTAGTWIVNPACSCRGFAVPGKKATQPWLMWRMLLVHAHCSVTFINLVMWRCNITLLNLATSFHIFLGICAVGIALKMLHNVHCSQNVAQHALLSKCCTMHIALKMLHSAHCFQNV
jgi:hypothetical protein